MNRIRRSVALIMASLMILATPCMAYAAEPGSFDAFENNSADESRTNADAGSSEEEMTEEMVSGEETPEEAVSGEAAEKGTLSEDSVSGEETSEETAAEKTTGETAAGETTAVTVVDSVEELSAESEAAYDNEAFFTIDASKKKTGTELATDEVNSEVSDILRSGGKASDKQEEIVDTLESSGFYRAEGSGRKNVEVTSKFAYQRLRLTAAQDSEINACGAVKAVYYRDHYLLSYDSIEATRTAYDALTAEYGAGAVMIDVPLRIRGEKGWGTAFMNMSREKEAAAAGGTVTVAVVDTGIKSSHEIFSGKTILRGYDFVSNDSDPADDNGHGTGVAGIIAESTPSNIQILPVKVMDRNGDGSLEDILAAIEYAAGNGADIINLSIGGYLDTYEELSACDSTLSGYDALIVCAVGNEGKDMDAPGVYEFPAEAGFTVSAASIDSGKKFSSFSNYGNAVDFALPGNGIELAALSGAYKTGSGTSFSSPYLASAAALIMAQNTGFTGKDTVDSLIGISEDLGDADWDRYFGYGCPVFSERTETAAADEKTEEEEIKEEEPKAESRPVLRAKTITPAVSLRENRFTYTGSEIRPAVTVKNVGTVLEEGRDYSISYSDNINAGTASVMVECTGRYKGSAAAAFTITQKEISPAIRLSGTRYTFDNSSHVPSVTVYDGADVLPQSQYDIAYAGDGRAMGRHFVTVTLKGNFKGSGTAAYRILPAGTKVSKLSGAKRAVSIRWKKRTSKSAAGRISGYQIQLATDPKFTRNVRKVTVKGYKRTSRKVSGLKSKKKYYVRVRTYRTVGSKKYCSDWSGAKTVKTK